MNDQGLLRLRLKQPLRLAETSGLENTAHEPSRLHRAHFAPAWPIGHDGRESGPWYPPRAGGARFPVQEEHGSSAEPLPGRVVAGGVDRVACEAVARRPGRD